MKFPLFSLLIALFSFVPSSALFQDPSPSRPGSASGDLRLPSGRLQRDEMLKADHARNIGDAESLIKLSTELKAELEKNAEHVLSVAAIKKTEEIEKTAKRIRSRMKRY